MCFEKYALYLDNFQLCVISVPGSLFRVPMKTKRRSGDEVLQLAFYLKVWIFLFKWNVSQTSL